MTQAEGAVSIVVPPWNGVFGKYLRSQKEKNARTAYAMIERKLLMKFILNEVEVRVLGSMIEKQITRRIIIRCHSTPDECLQSKIEPQSDGPYDEQTVMRASTVFAKKVSPGFSKALTVGF